MKSVARLLLLVALGCGGARELSADEPAQNSPARKSPVKVTPAKEDAQAAELAALRRTSLEFVAAFNQGDAQAVASHWTPEGELVDEAGQTYVGRAAIAAEYATLFQQQPRPQMRVVIDTLKLLSDTAALEEGRAMLDPAPPGAPALTKYLAVHVKVDGRWLMSAVREARVELPTTYPYLADLEFLVGTWQAEEHGAKTVSVCRWLPGKSFLERRYSVTTPDGLTSAGLQIIGWNPRSGQIESWNFSGDGGHAVGVWAAHDDGWQADVSGVTADGQSTSAIIHLRRLDDQAYVWQSTDRRVGENELPDTEEVVLKRVAP